MEFFELLKPYIIEMLIAILTFVGTWLGNKIGKFIDAKQEADNIRDIIASVVKYAEQKGKNLGSEEKLALAQKKAIEWASSKGIVISEIELEVMVEAFVNDFYKHYEDPVIEVEMEEEFTPEITN